MILRNIQMLLISMKKSELNLKLDADIFSSRVGSEVSSSRSMFHVGEPAIYIPPKQIPDQNSFPDPCSQLEPSKEHTLQVICVHSKLSASSGPRQTITCTRFSHFGLTLLEGVIFCGFLLGSFRDPPFLKWIDVVFNLICGIKILLVHIYIYTHNRKSTTTESTTPDRVLYLNKLELSELLQLWSLFFTFLLCMFPSNQFALTLVNTLRLVRLLFPFADPRTAQIEWRSSEVWHLVKLTFCILLTLTILAITMQFMLYNIDNYYCLTTKSLQMVEQGHLDIQKPAVCGVSQPCSSLEQSCVNVYAFASNSQQRQNVRKWLKESVEQGSFSHSLWGSLWAVMNTCGQSYQRYRGLMIQQILFPLFMLSWFLTTILPALGIAELVRQASIQNFKKNHRKDTSPPQAPTICYPRTSQCPIVEYSAQVQKISLELLSRTFSKKILTLLFHSLYLTQILLIVFYNLHFTNYPNINRNIGVALGVIFILWTFGLGLAVHEWVSEANCLENRVKTYTLLYQLLAYSLAACDYVIRIAFGTYLFESSTQMTPFSHGVIALRLLFILYNNGFDADVSYVMERLMANFVVNVNFIGLMLVLGTVFGFAGSYWLTAGPIQEQLRYIGNGIAGILGLGVGVGQAHQIEWSASVLMLGSVLVYICVMRSVLVGYSSVFQISYGLEQSELQASDGTSIIQERPKWIQNLRSLHTNTLYQKFKIVLVASYVCVSLVCQLDNLGANIFLFCADWFFLLDAFSRCAAFGLNSNVPFQILVIVCCLLSIVLFFLVDHIHPSVPKFLQTSHCLLLLDLVAELAKTCQGLIESLRHRKLKIWKSMLACSSLVISAGCLISIAVGEGAEYKEISDFQKLVTLIGHSVGYVYGLRWGQMRMGVMTLLCLQIMRISMILLLHGIFIFLFLTYLLHSHRGKPGQEAQRILNRISHHQGLTQSVSPTSPFNYAQVVTILMLVVSVGLLGSLSGSLLEHSWLRPHLATANLVLHLLDIFIYCLQNWRVKTATFFKSDTVLLGLSLPGSFFLMFPVVKFGGYIELAILIRIFMALSILRVLRLYRLLAHRSIFLLSSQILRRVYKQLSLSEVFNIIIVWVFLTLPFAVCQSYLSKSATLLQFVNLITGSSFTSPLIDPAQILPKLIYTIFVHFPLRIFLLSKVIINYLPLQTPTFPLAILEDSLCSTISELTTPVESEALILPLSSLYRFCAKLDRIFDDFINDKKRRKCLPYSQIVEKMKEMRINVCSYNRDDVNEYCVLANDVVRQLAAKYGCVPMIAPNIELGEDKRKKKSEAFAYSHFTIWQYWCWQRIKIKMMRKLVKRRLG